MKKAGILTVTGDNNYGNKLQNYAMRKNLMEMGYKVNTIRVDKKNYLYMRMITYIQVVFHRFFQKKNNRIIRRLAFYHFNKHLSQKTFLRTNETRRTIERKLSKYDYLIYGSDQIWNPELPQYSDIFLGKYAPKEKNIAVSASMGISVIPERMIQEFRNGFINFKAISVREEKAKTEIENLDKDLYVEVIADPTMTLDRSQWIAVEKETKTPSHYCLTYFLGEENTNITNSIIQKKECQRFYAGPQSPFGPAEFIYLVHHSNAVLTDSYHATIFSLIFQVPVYIFERKDAHSSMNSRIDNLLKRIGIPYEQNHDYIYISDHAMNNQEVQNKLKAERETFMAFLRKSME